MILARLDAQGDAVAAGSSASCCRVAATLREPRRHFAVLRSVAPRQRP